MTMVITIIIVTMTINHGYDDYNNNEINNDVDYGDNDNINNNDNKKIIMVVMIIK